MVDGGRQAWWGQRLLVLVIGHMAAVGNKPSKSKYDCGIEVRLGEHAAEGAFVFAVAVSVRVGVHVGVGVPQL